jgi:hypothetical protein
MGVESTNEINTVAAFEAKTCRSVLIEIVLYVSHGAGAPLVVITTPDNFASHLFISAFYRERARGIGRKAF